ncbi:histidine kinase [Herbiconiux sp. KACC 21604]|uniref:sensor histidine kinase n=1 Tax=unclassified Herbiconiux TaxID=2618217 RepID=UPI0014920B16|nr:histidine kinase [Herbiconiux sp. SALV-R1]QJU53444.1 hypothetical protein HL652_07250 [Herbiconiux sp. SALV-R1]WPO88413.1 histidine kinase [Herbiconiux sp. KACC 21604]
MRVQPSHLARAPELLVAVGVLVVGGIEAVSTNLSGYGSGPALVQAVAVLGTATAVAAMRRAPWLSFGVLWALLILQAATTTDVLLVQIAVVGVAFGIARWGSTVLLWVSGISIPIAAVISFLYINSLAYTLWQTRIARNLIVPLVDAGIAWPVFVLPLILSVLALPWLAGLVTRYWGAARRSQRSQAEAESAAARAAVERERMAEIATLRENQARLARDVHDVVGHSLTVILAQAESAQFLDDSKPEALKATMATIARSARSSLQEVRAVLSSPDGTTGHPTDLDALISSTRESGLSIVVADTGVVRPLPPELATVAFRVLQEMLTNALKHGRRDSVVAVHREWGDLLRLTVTNQPGDAPAPGDAGHPGGEGLPGMRRRVESVGGSLLVSTGVDGSFVVTAVLPLRAGAPYPAVRV